MDVMPARSRSPHAVASTLKSKVTLNVRTLSGDRTATLQASAVDELKALIGEKLCFSVVTGMRLLHGEKELSLTGSAETWGLQDGAVITVIVGARCVWAIKPQHILSENPIERIPNQLCKVDPSGSLLWSTAILDDDRINHWTASPCLSHVFVWSKVESSTGALLKLQRFSATTREPEPLQGALANALVDADALKPMSLQVTPDGKYLFVGAFDRRDNCTNSKNIYKFDLGCCALPGGNEEGNEEMEEDEEEAEGPPGFLAKASTQWELAYQAEDEYQGWWPGLAALFIGGTRVLMILSNYTFAIYDYVTDELLLDFNVLLDFVSPALDRAMLESQMDDLDDADHGTAVPRRVSVCGQYLELIPDPNKDAKPGVERLVLDLSGLAVLGVREGVRVADCLRVWVEKDGETTAAQHREGKSGNSIEVGTCISDLDFENINKHMLNPAVTIVKVTDFPDVVEAMKLPVELQLHRHNRHYEMNLIRQEAYMF